MPRVITAKPAEPGGSPLSLSIYGASNSGKTFSALRMAMGICKAWGVDPARAAYLIDTENRRALHYAEHFKFMHVDFPPPFGSLDYLEFIQYCVKEGARVIVVDSASHEHSGEGGMLDRVENMVEAKMRGNNNLTEATARKMVWNEAKEDRKKFEREILRIHAQCAVILCYRAGTHLDFKSKGQDAMKDLGYKAETTSKLPYEMSARFLLYPCSQGVPTINSTFMHEREMIKLPDWCASWFSEPVQLSEEIGERFGRWAMGPAQKPPLPPERRDDLADLRAEWGELKNKYGLDNALLVNGLKHFQTDLKTCTAEQLAQVIGGIKSDCEGMANNG